jgi:hypothetical protein
VPQQIRLVNLRIERAVVSVHEHRIARVYLVAPLLAGTDPVVLVDRSLVLTTPDVSSCSAVLAPTHVRPLTEQRKDYVLAVARRGFRRIPICV